MTIDIFACRPIKFSEVEKMDGFVCLQLVNYAIMCTAQKVLHLE